MKPDATVTSRAYFSEDVLLVSGSPTLPIVVGSSERDNSTYNSGHTSANFNFTYRILPLLASGENDDDGISINQNAFSLNSAVITDKADNLADNISHSAVPDNESFKVDTIPPAVSSFTMDDIEAG